MARARSLIGRDRTHAGIPRPNKSENQNFYIFKALINRLFNGTGCLFGFVHKKKPTYLERFIREESSQRAPPYFVDGGSIN